MSFFCLKFSQTITFLQNLTQISSQNGAGHLWSQAIENDRFGGCCSRYGRRNFDPLVVSNSRFRGGRMVTGLKQKNTNCKNYPCITVYFCTFLIFIFSKQARRGVSSSKKEDDTQIEFRKKTKTQIPTQNTASRLCSQTLRNVRLGRSYPGHIRRIDQPCALTSAGYGGLQ